MDSYHVIKYPIIAASAVVFVISSANNANSITGSMITCVSHTCIEQSCLLCL